MDLIQSINEKRGTFSADTFRPSESQKAVLLAMDQITAGDRVMKKADVTSNENEEKAFDILSDLGLIEVDRHEQAVLTSAGSKVVDNTKAADPELAGEEDMDLGAEEPTEEPSAEEDLPMENFKLLKDLNTTLLETNQLNEMKAIFTKDDVNFLKNLQNNPEMNVSDNEKLEAKLMDFYAAEIPYGVETGDEGTPDDWFADRIDMILKDVKGYIVE